ncbi:MAG: universal stress protein [Puniceicoccaceae bacterium]|nr:MAG: universal stress protein [Puniceicoccaceae bacterium]
MPQILTCTDGSHYANSVYHYSAWAAKQMGASIHVLHMLDPLHEDPLNADFSGSIGLGAKKALMEELVELEATRARIALKRGQAILDDARERMVEAGVARVTTEQRHERLSDSIDQYHSKVDLVVLGKRGNHADFAKGHLGSNLERVIRSCTHPVLVASSAEYPMQRFVLAFDGGQSAQKAVRYAAESSLLKGMSCHLICAGKAEPKLQTALEAAQAELKAAGYEVDVDILEGEPATVITEAIDKESADLLVMGAYGSSRLRKFFVGSTTTEMIRGTKRPVLLFR